MGKEKLANLIEIAIEREETSYALYKGLQDKVGDKGVKDTLEFLAKEEKKHKEFLVNYREGRLGTAALQLSAVIDYKIAEYIKEPAPHQDMESKDVYLLAAHRELQSYSFYKALADLHPDGKAKNMLRTMANQELKHKEKVEYLYANTAFPQTAGG